MPASVIKWLFLLKLSCINPCPHYRLTVHRCFYSFQVPFSLSYIFISEPYNLTFRSLKQQFPQISIREALIPSFGVSKSRMVTGCRLDNICNKMEDFSMFQYDKFFHRSIHYKIYLVFISIDKILEK